MAYHKSAAKRNRQRLVRTTATRSVRSHVRHVLKSARLAVEEGSEGAAKLVSEAMVLLDRAASKNALPFKRVSRLKSRLAKKLNAASKA